MWTYEQRSGRLFHEGKELIGKGYAGMGEGKNNPEMQSVHNIGPLPRGIYWINPPMDTEQHGPFVLWLTPEPTNEMYGRSDFGIHGDSKAHPGQASQGCIVLSRDVREQIWNSGDRKLEVVSGDAGEMVPDLDGRISCA